MAVKSILDPTFRYYKACETDLRRTFARIRREQKEQTEKIAQEQRDKVRTFPKVTK